MNAIRIEQHTPIKRNKQRKKKRKKQKTTIRISTSQHYLHYRRLMLTSIAIKPRETLAESRSIVAQSSARTIAPRFVAESVEWIGTTGTFLHLTGRASISGVAETTNTLHRIPGLKIDASCFFGQYTLREARTTIIASLRTHAALTRQTIVSLEAFAPTRATIAETFVRAFRPGMQIVRIHDFSDPGEPLRTRTKRTIRARPLGFSIQTYITLAIGIEFTGTMPRAPVFTDAM